MTTSEQNKEVVRQLYEVCLNERKFQLLDNIISPEYEGGAKVVAAPLIKLLGAFKDMLWKVDDIIGEGDKVFVYYSLKGTHTGEYQNAKPTGKVVSTIGMAMYHLKDKKIIRSKVLPDRLDFNQQLNLITVNNQPDLTTRSVSGTVSFIDKFILPVSAKEMFYERVRINRDFIRNIPGFIEDAAYESSDGNGSIHFITVALWESKEALAKAKELVQDKYKKEGFDPTQFMKSLNIAMDRAMYTPVE